LKILIIEDSVPIRENLAEILELGGYDVKSTADGQSGLTALQDDPIDLLISDIHLPDISGVDIVRMLRTRPETQNLKVLLISADTEVDIGRDHLVRFLQKPFKIKDLLRIVEEMILTS
jgi:CheY-like chemotaxis protein